MKSMGWAVLAASLAIFLGCTELGVHGGVSEADAGKLQNIAVYSGLGSHLQLERLGTPTFQNKFSTADVHSWQLDGFAEKSMIQKLKTNPRFQMVASIKGPSVRPEELSSDSILRLLNQAKEQGFDTVVALLPSEYVNAPLMKPGYGVHRNANGGADPARAYLLAAVRVYDTATAKSVAWQWAFDELSGHPSLLSPEDVPWKDQFADYSKDQQAVLAKTIRAQITRGLDYALPALNLIKPTVASH